MSKQTTRDTPGEILQWIESSGGCWSRLEPRSFYDKHIVGVCHRSGEDPALVYSMPGILNSHVEEGMTLDEALEWFRYNTLDACDGRGRPIFIDQTPFNPIH